MLAVTVFVDILLPRTFEVGTKIFAQRNLVMPSLGNPRRSIPNETDAPTRGAADSILAYDNLVALVKETNLVERWEARRPALLRWKDRVVQLFSTPLTEPERQRALVGLLERRLWVQADESTIRISVQWNDPGLAFDIVSHAQAEFLERRGALETSVISDAIGILEGVASKEREALGAALAHATDVASKISASQGSTGRVVVAPVAPFRAPALTEPETSPRAVNEAGLLATRLEAKRAQIRAVQEPWQQHLADLRARLADTRQTYAPAHPFVIVLEGQVADASVEPPALAQLRAEEAALLAEIEATATVAPPPPPVVHVKAAGAHPSPARQETALVVREDPPELAEARAALRAASVKYEELEDRIDAARIELATAQAAFKYRYRVVLPPELPKKPIRPDSVRIWAGGGLLALLLAFAVAIGRDLLGGRFVASAQVRRLLRVPLLAEVNGP